MTFGEPSPEIAEGLKEEFLPQGRASDIENSELLGVTFRSPQADPTASSGGGAAGDLGSGPGGAVHDRGVGVRERRVLNRYFSSED